jgi:predicted Zn-dependent peptidase
VLTPKPTQEILGNGLRVLVVPQTHLQGATLSVFVKTGPRYEQKRTNGISHFLEHMLFRGTKSYATPYDLSFAAESLGGTIDAATYADFTQFQISVPREHAEQGLALLADLLLAPKFTDLALEKRIVREEILADLDEDGREVDAENLSRMLVYGADDPLGFKITGDADNVDSFGEAELREHLREHYGAANMAVVATGAVEPLAMIAAAQKLFGELPRGTVTLIDRPPPPRHGERLRFVENDAAQTDVRILFRAFGSADPDFTALKLLVRILDDGMSTRLHRRLTDDSGLAYEVFSALDPYEETGLVEIGASVEHDKVAALTAEALAMMAELRDGGANSIELAKARTRYAWTLRRIIDSPEDMAMYVGTQSVFGRSTDLAHLLAEVESVSLERLSQVARRVIRSEGMHVLCVGKLTRAQRKQTEQAVANFR